MNRSRLVIDFVSPEALAEWVQSIRHIQGLPRDVAVFEMDGLDDQAVTQNSTFILKRAGARPDQFRLRIVTTQTVVTEA